MKKIKGRACENCKFFDTISEPNKMEPEDFVLGMKSPYRKVTICTLRKKNTPRYGICKSHEKER